MVLDVIVLARVSQAHLSLGHFGYIVILEGCSWSIEMLLQAGRLYSECEWCEVEGDVSL